MQFKYVSGSPAAQEADVLALCVASDGGRDADFKAVDKNVGGLLSARIKELGFAGNVGESLIVRPKVDSSLPRKTRAVALLGAGPRKQVDGPLVRNLAANAVKLAGQLRGGSLAFVVPAAASVDVALSVQLATEGVDLATYRFDKYRAKDSRKPSPVKRASLVATAPKGAALNQAVDRGKAVAEAVMRARDLVNEPAARMTPRQLAVEARAVAKKHARVTVKVMGPAECKKLGMGMLLAVGQGSEEEIRLIHLTYKPPGKPEKRVALIGKGITFDSGGYSLKPSASMLDMKIDMAGAAAVIAAMDAIGRLDCPHEVHAVAACAENLVSGGAYKLGDVLTSMSGKTVEINNTDAEGRLALGDALTYTREKIHPDEMFDFATLTGACMVALGPHTAGVLSHSDKLAGAWLEAAARAGEDMWRLPLNPRLKEQLKSNIADMKNTGGRAGGALTAGLFLSEFAGDTPWVHVDIAGPASASKESGATAEGATGFAVATILEYLRH